MTITLEMILTRFFQEYPESRREFKTPKHHLLGVRLLPKKTEHLSRDYVYISDCYNEKMLSEIDSSVSVICLVSEPEPVSDFSNVLLLPSDLELAEGFNCLQKSYHDFAEWERQLDFAVFRDASFQEMISLSEAILSAPILVYDPALKLLAHSPHHETLKDPIFQNAVKNGYLDLETVKYFEQARSFEQINLSGSSEGEADSYRSHADFVRAININNELAVYCVLLYTGDVSRSYIHQLFDVLCEAFRNLL